MDYLVGNNLVKQYGQGETAVQAVKGIDLKVRAGEMIAIMGESGSGKSTLLSMLGALNTPTSGRYLVKGIDVYSLGQDERADFRRNFLGFVFQSFHLVPYLSVEENVMLPLVSAGKGGKDQRALAEEALSRVGLAGKGKRLPNQLSGGEQERVAIARAIVNNPPILLADEPTGNLDRRTSQEIMVLLQGLHSRGMTVVLVTHNRDCARYAGRILHLSDGLLMGTEEVRPRIGDPGALPGKERIRAAAAHLS